LKHLLLFDLAHFIIDGFTAHKTLIVFIILGCIAGLIAQLITPGRGFGLVATAIIGIAACLVSNIMLVKHLTFFENHVLKELVGATIVAIILSLCVNLVRGKEQAGSR
jgi:uncharacterized membrane protein YeaQ/YmgE (transglycosylase-associated protein family)